MGIEWLKRMVRKWELTRDEADRLRESNRLKLAELKDIVDRGECSPAQLEVLDVCLTAMSEKVTDKLKGKKV